MTDAAAAPPPPPHHMADHVESWDDEFEGNFHNLASHSANTTQSNFSSRVSVASESLAGGDDDWNLVLQPDNEQSTHQAVASAKAAGIPLPANVPQSALLGGTIKRLGNRQKGKQRVTDDWDEDIEMPDGGGALQLKQPQPIPIPSGAGMDHDDFDDLEGSLGIRFAGTKRDFRARSSSASAMSPSLGSITAESEEDDLRGLELPEGPVDFDAMLKKRCAADAELSDLSQPSPALEQPATMNVHKKSRLLTDENEDYLLDFEIGAGGFLDNRHRNINRNIKVKSAKPTGPALRPQTTLNFHEKPVDRPMHTTTRSHIPRPVSGSKPAVSRLEPVLEAGAGASRAIRERRQPATTTTAQLLKSKRSLPAMRSQAPVSAANRPPLPSQHSAFQRMPYHLRHDSDPHRAQSPPLRSHSRLSNAFVPETPSRQSKQRPNVAPTSLAREAAAKRMITKPTRKVEYGNGNELEIFDDLPTSTAKENKFVKQPIGRGPPKLNIRQTQSRSDIRESARRNNNNNNNSIPDRMVTPAPRTPMSPTKGFHDAPAAAYTPSYMRDTASSRITRETRLSHNNNNSINSNNTNSYNANSGYNYARPRSDGPLPLAQLSNNLSRDWRPQSGARGTPNTSPSVQRHKQKSKQPQLIKGIGAHVAKTEKGMVYNPTTLRWEGNENTLSHFDLHAQQSQETPTPSHPSFENRRHHHNSSLENEPPYFDRGAVGSGNGVAGSGNGANLSSSPPRPALIAPMSNAATQGIQVNGGMVFDPRQMKWLKLKDHHNHQQSSRGHVSHRPAGGFFGGNGSAGGGRPLSPSITDAAGSPLGADDDTFGTEEEEEDAFAGIPDLVDEFAQHPSIMSGAGAGAGAGAGRGGDGLASPVSLPTNQQQSGLAGAGAGAGAGAAVGGLVGEVHEEFDLGPRFIEMQTAEEAVWRKRCAAWFAVSPSTSTTAADTGAGAGEQDAEVAPWRDDGAWRWAIRDIARYDGDAAAQGMGGGGEGMDGGVSGKGVAAW